MKRNGTAYRNINKSLKIKKLEKKLKREQKALSRKLEAKKRDKKGGSYSNIEKQKLKVQRLHKTCHECGSLKKDLKLSDRIYRCEHCGAVIDRDFNAALNLRDAKVYEIAG